MPPLNISPPLLNSANPWCTTLDQLRELYACPYTGAVTTRTSTLEGFPHDDSIHQFTFFDPSTHASLGINPSPSTNAQLDNSTGSLNTLGYSPFPLSKYLSFIKTISDELPPSADGSPKPGKPIIISITGSEQAIAQCYRQILALQQQIRIPLAIEINLSCPNIPGKPPPAYDAQALLSYLSALKTAIASSLPTSKDREPNAAPTIPIGIKTPPYTHHAQFESLITTLLKSAVDIEPTTSPCPIDFITATNTLGSCLLLSSSPSTSSGSPALHSASGDGIGGLAGAPLHPLALGNVATIAKMLRQHAEELGYIRIIGVGGVQDAQGARRMESVGAYAVGVGTAFGRKGVGVFEEIGVGRRVEGMVEEWERGWAGRGML
ncbi:FMN-linked oxidoreductase [Westerdykella ornata]|uniref:Dihydroorotate dehydrogenase (fumarate) n=1 Tax=Westerdykella ornata TaxID=318751 RepID=A0A6A6JI64_WESOR|nr:FMN-linked oxidoreductase [Westerdykella ornata]KAF2276087.1 FMN-linked oxidoreductase [Westerdykella ornata]